MISAVVVTYNRKYELSKNLDMLYKQTINFDKIIVVDNCSTDGTEEFIKSIGYIDQDNFLYLRNEKNIGGAGGFYTGIHKAYEIGSDLIILMDDDGRPSDNKTFENLVSYANKILNENVSDGKIFINSLVVCDEKLTFRINNITTVNEAEKIACNGIIENAAHPFNGTLISRKLIEEIGFPNKDFFIKGDEIDYKQRASRANAYISTVTYSKYYHPCVPTKEKTILGKLVPIYVESPWKEYYTARNLTYIYKSQKYYKMIIFELIFVKLYAIFTLKCPKIKTIKYLFLGIIHGLKGKLGDIIKP